MKLPEISVDARFTPNDFQEVLLKLPEDCPLVGGQAVAWWAERYKEQLRRQGNERMVTSRDIDFWGAREDLVALAKNLGRRAVFPHQYEMTVWVGAVPLEVGGKRTMAEFLHTIPGLDTNNPDSACVEQEIEIAETKRRLKVLTPVSLILVKLHGLRHFDQRQRQDAFHLSVSIETACCFISELLDAKQVRLALWNIRRLVECQRLKATVKLEKEHGCRILDAVPLERIREQQNCEGQSAEDRQKLQRFCEEYWPRVVDG